MVSQTFFVPKRHGEPNATLVIPGFPGLADAVHTEVGGLSEFGEKIHRKTGSMDRFISKIGVKSFMFVLLGVTVALALLSPWDYQLSLLALLLIDTALFKSVAYVHGLLTYVKNETTPSH